MTIDNIDNDSYYGIITLSFTSLLVRLSIWLPQGMSNKINLWAAFISILLIFCYAMFLSAIYTLFLSSYIINWLNLIYKNIDKSLAAIPDLL